MGNARLQTSPPIPFLTRFFEFSRLRFSLLEILCQFPDIFSKLPNSLVSHFNTLIDNLLCLLKVLYCLFHLYPEKKVPWTALGAAAVGVGKGRQAKVAHSTT